jgi:cell division protein FtsX
MAWEQLRSSPINTAMTTVIMAVVLSLSVLGVLIIHNTHRLLEHARGSVGLTIYLADGDEAEIRSRLENYFQADKRIASAYIFGAICPYDGKGTAFVLPACNV